VLIKLEKEYLVSTHVHVTKNETLIAISPHKEAHLLLLLQTRIHLINDNIYYYMNRIKDLYYLKHDQFSYAIIVIV